MFMYTEVLVDRYAFDLRLWTPDGLQLAVALELHRKNQVDYFVAADNTLCEVAALEGFAVLSPEKT